ncbi:hypothetical protein PAESOLCIP111_05731 [Paenibacillus solanacearum]|uniref:Transglutaminase-like domain-containing protein n=1 Tax=Paenibacillus solanacearum TaxID=2048548 RepID=A0A916K8D3_9BACL|nr:transglutaminase family protein [Paenibacillus solanacearum]CAG7648915.1 hypothetical protein PAESOLCIP111_05731 [Paenibacillus solanacearum]
MPSSASDFARTPARLAADALLSGLLLLVLLEWLYPLRELVAITEVYSIRPFVMAFSVFVLVDTFRWNPWLVWPAKMLWIVAVTAWLHNGQALPSADWWGEWSRGLLTDVVEGLQGHLAAWEPATRTLLFLTGWSFFISVVQSFVLERRSVLWFLMLTGSFLVLIQLVFAVDSSVSMLRAFGIGLLLQTLLQRGYWTRWQEEADAHEAGAGHGPSPAPAHTEERSAGRSSSLMAGVAFAAVCLAVGWLGSGFHPSAMKAMDWSRYIAAWENRLQSHTWTDQYLANGGSARWGVTGYSSDDAELGRPLRADDRPAFTAVTTMLTYWRGETRSVYTGKGWATADNTFIPAGADANAAAAPLSSPGGGLAKEMVIQQVRLQSGDLSRQLFAGGELRSVTSLQAASGKAIPADWVWRESATDRYALPVLTDPLASYTIESFVLADRSQLETMPELPYGAEIAERYLQLPESLPLRVRELGETIAGQEKTPYAKAIAVERYLKEHYAYNLENSREPGADEDFVDHFLFTQMAGYCDHFSTAMVVLLRSVGVPARWVKGFAPGEVLSVEAEGERSTFTVQVRQKDAHAWTEVYFPGAGWVTFEPTPSYAAGSAAQVKPSAVVATAAEPQTETRFQAMQRQLEQAMLSAKFTAQHVAAAARSSLRSMADSIRNALAGVSLWTAGGLGVAVILGLAAVVHLWTRLAHAPDRSGTDLAPRSLVEGLAASGYGRDRLLRFSDRLWRRLQRVYGKAKPQQTLREYAGTREVDSEAKREELLRLTELLEASRYAEPNRAALLVTRRELSAAWAKLKRAK